jgi:hypothetical protein
MSVTALQAAALRDSLAGGGRDLPQRFFRAAAKPAGTAWQLAAGADLSLPQVKGPRPLPVRVTNAYVNRALTAAEHDPAVAERFLRVASLQDRPPRMFRPSTALRVALANRPRRRTPAAEAAEGHRSSRYAPEDDQTVQDPAAPSREQPEWESPELPMADLRAAELTPAGLAQLSAAPMRRPVCPCRDR